jgi:hypothetical protein
MEYAGNPAHDMPSRSFCGILVLKTDKKPPSEHQLPSFGPGSNYDRPSAPNYPAYRKFPVGLEIFFARSFDVLRFSCETELGLSS